MTKKKLYHYDKPLIGLDVSQTGLRLVAANPKTWKVAGYGSVNLDPLKLQHSLNNGDEYLTKAIKTLINKNLHGHLPSNQIAVSVPTSKTYSRTLNLPSNAEGNLTEAINLEAEQYIPVPTEELNIDHQVIERSKDNISILLSAAPKKIIENIVASAKQNNLDVVLVEPGISAVARLLNRTENGQLPTIIVDIGAANTDIAIFNKSIRVSGGISVGGNSFTISISEKLKVSLEEAHKIKVLEGLNSGKRRDKIEQAISGNLDSISSEINKMMRYYTDRLEMNDKIEQIIMVGGGSNVPSLADYFTDKLELPVRAASPWQKLHFSKLTPPSKQSQPRFISAIGLSLVEPQELWK